MSHPPTTRRRGGQPGNINRLRHGLYSRRLSTPAQDRAASPTETPDPRFQLALARRRLAQLLDQQESALPHDWLSYERGIAHYLSLISSLWWKSVRPAPSNPINLSQHDGHPFVSMLESLHRLEPEAAADANLDLYPIRTSDPGSENDP